jgi:hypothetical protein
LSLLVIWFCSSVRFWGHSETLPPLTHSRSTFSIDPPLPSPKTQQRNQRTTKCPIRLLSIFSFYFFSLSKAFPPWVFQAPNKPNQDPLWVNESSFSDPVHDLKLFVRHTPTNQYTTLLFCFLVFIRGCCLRRPSPPSPPSLPPFPHPPPSCQVSTAIRPSIQRPNKAQTM